ncbi:MAG: polymerase, sigma-24 subunit, subfamily [Chlorobi bacterium]|jgi:RNA polymerase sigma factor (sigma-70 family)|nr:polymerase, sigma-24 subunit, subfamily [Chlorobiota bacterium]
MPNRETISKEERQLRSRQEDYDLVARALQGDQSAYARLRNKYWRSIEAMLSRMIRDKNDAEDLTQEAFIKAFNSLQSFNTEYAFSTWLYKIASNNCIDYLRKRRLKTVSIDAPVQTHDGEVHMEIADPSAVRPDVPLTSAERTAVLQDAIRNLPEKYRIVIELRHTQEMEYADIARKLELPLGTVKAHLFRARALLLKRLQGKLVHFEED